MQPIEPAGLNPTRQSTLSDRAVTAQPPNSQLANPQSVSDQIVNDQSISQSVGSQSSVQQSSVQQSSISQTTSSQSVSISSTTSRTTMVQEQVGAMLESINPGMAQDNQYLKLLIAALIMNALLNGNESSGQQSAGQNGQGAMRALEDLAGGRNNSFFLSIETSTNTVQIGQMSTRLETTQAAQSISQYQQGDPQSGGNMDVAG